MGIVAQLFPVAWIAGKDAAVFGFLPDFDVRMVGADMTLATGVRIAGHGNIEGMLGMAGVTLADALVGPKVTNIVAFLAAVLGGDGRLKDVPIERGGEIDHRQCRVLAAAKLLVGLGVAGGAVTRSGMGSDRASIMRGIVPVPLLRGVAGETVDSLGRML